MYGLQQTSEKMANVRQVSWNKAYRRPNCDNTTHLLKEVEFQWNDNISCQRGRRATEMIIHG